MLILTKADYNESYFNGGGAIGGYDNYSATTYSSETAEQLATKFLEKSGILGINLVGKKVLVCGCAYGFLAKYLISLGVQAYGMDFSAYAISQVPSDISTKVILGDARLDADFVRAKTLAGLTRANDKFDLIIDEDMLCCLSDAEAVTFRTLALKYSNMFIHLITVAPVLSTWYNYKTITEWHTLLGTSPKEKYYSRFNWSEI
jgi:2-polyprenyl-3-methyl-5-hydroxy-6-metoxy-1,4-benzoquinol methylase